MHIAPFHFTVHNGHDDSDFMGYLTYKPSRRDDQKLRVYINTGAGNDFITELHPTIHLESGTGWFEYDYLEMFAQWLEMHAYDGEHFDKSLPGEERTEESLKEFFKENGAELRFW